MEKITAIVQGEIETVVVSIETSEPNKLNVPDLTTAEMVEVIGRSLDGRDDENLTIDQRNAGVAILISLYVSAMRSYRVMLAKGLKTIVLTIFRSRGTYNIRAAGILPFEYNEASCTLDGDLIPTHHGMVLAALSTCPYYTEKYEEGSNFHKLISEARSTGLRIEITESK